MWYKRLQENYEYDFEQFKVYDRTYGLAKRLGFESAEDAWEADPLCKGSVYPEDFQVVTDPAEILKAGIAKVKAVREEEFGNLRDEDMAAILDVLESPTDIPPISPC